MPFVAKSFTISKEEKQELLYLSNSTKTEYRLVYRANIILLLSDGLPYSAIKKQLNTNDSAISKWKRRFV